MKTVIKISPSVTILLFLLFSCKKEESKYPINLKLIDIKKGEIKAYTKTDSIIPNNYTYKSIDEFDYFNKFIIKGIIFNSHEQATLIYGDSDPENETNDSLRLNATVSYSNDSIFFSVNETIEGWNFLFSYSGVGDEYRVEFNGTQYIKLYPYGLDGFIIYKNFNLEELRNELSEYDTLIFYHFSLTYE